MCPQLGRGGVGAWLMLHLVDMAIHDVLRAELPELLPADVTVAVSFTASTEEPVGATILGRQPSQGVARACTVHALLFDVAKNKGLRTGAGPETSTRSRGAPSLWVEATYHISVTLPGDGAIGAQTEHLVLGAVLEALSRHRELPDAFLPPRLRDSRTPVHGSVLEGAVVDRSEFWRALGEKPRSYFTYLVTFALPPPRAPDEGVPVDSYTISIQRKDVG